MDKRGAEELKIVFSGLSSGPAEGQKNWESYSTPNLYLNQQILGELKYLDW